MILTFGSIENTSEMHGIVGASVRESLGIAIPYPCRAFHWLWAWLAV